MPLDIEPDAETPGGAVVRVTAEVDGRPVSFILDAAAAQSQVIEGEVPVTVADTPQSSDSRGLFSQPGRSMGTLGSVRLAGVHREGLDVTLANRATRSEICSAWISSTDTSGKWTSVRRV